MNRGRGPRVVGGRTPRVDAGYPLFVALLAAAAVLAPNGSVLAQTPTPVDTAAAARAEAVRGETIPGDTIPADSVLTPRQRAIERLRAMPSSPIQRDTATADTVAGDTLADGTPPADTAPAGMPGAGPGLNGAPGGLAGSSGAERTVAGDSVFRLLRSLDGYVRTEYAGESAVFEGEGNRLLLQGRSKVGRDQNTLSTDSLLDYRGDTGVVCGYGNPVLSGERDPVTSQRLCYDIERDLGMAEGARTKFVQGATWYVRGANNQVFLLAGAEKPQLYARRADFTSCELEEPHYTFQARSLKMTEGEMMIARDVTLRFDDVPVFWLPWMVQSMRPDRRSGLLTPQFGVNDIVRNSSGYTRRISNLGFYWAMNDYMSAQTAFEWYSGNWKALQGSVNYRWLDRFLNGQLTFNRYWRESGRTELTLNTNNSWRPDERTSVRAAGTYTTSSDFVRQNSFDPHELSRDVSFNAGVNRSFSWGRANTGYQRRHNLMDDRVTQTWPSLSLQLSPVTLFTSESGATTMTWSGGADFSQRTVTVPDTLRGRSQEGLSANASHRLGFGRFAVSQNARYEENVDLAKPPVGADTALPRLERENLAWSTSASYQLDLWTGTTLSPSVGMSGRMLRDDRTEGEFLEDPTRIQVGASLNTTVFGFWPGFGPFSRIRHKVSPGLSWSYSPTPSIRDPLQETVFGLSNLREQNRISLSFNQTFEARYAESDTARASPDGAGTGNGGAGGGRGEPDVDGEGVGERDAPGAGEPRRLPQARIITLLAVNTSPSFLYDFVSAREDGRGFLQPMEISNSLRSDLLRGFRLDMTHSLFELGERPADGGLQPRTFDPFLTRVGASFSIDNNFWLFEALGLTRDSRPADRDREQARRDADAPDEDAIRRPGPAGGTGSILGGPGGGRSAGLGSQVGGWRASLNYSLLRNRPGPLAQEASQTLRGDFSFRPTELWSVRWSTAYSFTQGEFSDHVLTLSRDLHRWQANFDFIKAQNGNFAFQFRVQLIDNPDLKVDYDQRSDPARAVGPGSGPGGIQ